MTVQLEPIVINDSKLFKANVYAADGVTLVTPLSCTCSVWNADTGAVVVNNQAGTVGSGYAQYNWAGIGTAGNYVAVLTVVVDATTTQSEEYRVQVMAKPPTYTNDVATNIVQVRLELGDDVEGEGVRPNSSNLSDPMIQTWLTREGSVMRAVAAACEALARMWANAALSLSQGPRSVTYRTSEQWAARAATLREQYGYGASGAGGGFSIGMRRADGYAEYADGTEYATA